MRRLVSLLCMLSFFLGAEALYYPSRVDTATGPVCARIQQVISNASAVYYRSDTAYAQDIWHYMTSSTQNSACTVEPGTVGDVSKIVRYISTSQLLIPIG